MHIDSLYKKQWHGKTNVSLFKRQDITSRYENKSRTSLSNVSSTPKEYVVFNITFKAS